MHPLVTDLSKLKDSEIEAKISELTRKYMMTYNTDVKTQISMLLEVYNNAINARRTAEWERIMQTRESDFKNLINIE